ncbi:MAG TPA: metallopeptidase TldD-related protein [Sandaracinaceae bacterium LLY-WYZ-13_1]|nr:metallopeptidase TldD-related protein [Sandaracinaceae bacterium LLY-WYZ-13_1]
MSRRDVLRKGAVAGTAAVTMPSFLAACGASATRAAVAGTTPDAAGADPVASIFGVSHESIRRTLGELTSRGADQAELFFQSSRSTSILYQDGIVSQAHASVDLGVGLRCVVGDQTGYAYTEELTDGSMREAARTAAAIAHDRAVTPPQQIHHERLPHDRYAIEVPWRDVGIDDKLPLVQRCAEIVRSLEPAVVKVEVSWADAESRVLIADMRGRMVFDERPMTRMFVTVTAERDGARQTNRANIAARRGIDFYTEENLRQVAQQAVDRTMILFEARRPPAGEMPVVLARGASGILLHEAIGHGMEADFNRKEISIYADMLNRQVAEDFVTIVDDGSLENERGALNVDDEGRPAGRTVLVENGRLVSYMHDGISSRHYGVSPTGSGRRQSFRHAPMPRMRCTYMEPGPHTRDEIIGSVQRGILAETFTNGQVQIGAGDYTFYIKNGWLIEDGRLTAPIKDVNIIGTGPETLRRISMVGDDATLDTGGWTCGKRGQSVPVSLGIPTVLVRELTVGGEDAA